MIMKSFVKLYAHNNIHCLQTLSYLCLFENIPFISFLFFLGPSNIDTTLINHLLQCWLA